MYLSPRNVRPFTIAFALLAATLLATNASRARVTTTAAPARMEVRDGEVSLRVEASNATNPATTDALFTEVKKLTASDRAAGDTFGEVSSVDADTVVIGTRFDDSRRGAAYVFQRNKNGGDNWGEVKKLLASDGLADDLMGTSVGISGDTIVVGAPGEGTRGAAYVYDRNAGGADNWGQVKKITPLLTSTFGQSVGISDDTIIVGAYTSSGGVFVFERNRGGVNNWGEVKKVTASDGDSGDAFGWASAISGDTIIVGARADDVLGGTDNGSAYVFERNKGGFDNWGEVKKLTASGSENGQQFGHPVAISNSTIAVTTLGDAANKGAVFIYERNKGGADNWGEVKKLVASDGATNHLFGSGVGISGDTLVAGAQGRNGNRGAVYVFQRNNRGADNWGELKKLTASDAAAGDRLGESAAISGDTVISGAGGDDSSRGSAYVFAGHDSLWIQQRKTTASDAAPDDLYGAGPAVSGDTTVIGAFGNNLNRGAAYVLERNKGGSENWGEVKRLTASDGEAG